MNYLTSQQLKEMFINSYIKVNERKEEINKINFFPIADWDTGTNLTNTLKGIKEEIENKNFNNFGKFSIAVINKALEVAQGNVGVIFTGFLIGFLSSFNKNPISINDLAVALENGFKKAKTSIQEPKEGTILDVIETITISFKENLSIENLKEILEIAIKNGEQALLKTKEKLDILKKAGVVDAGALGFLLIFKSWLETIKKNTFSEINLEKATFEENSPVNFNKKEQYEIVWLIKNKNLKKEFIQEKLKKFGDSLDIVSFKNKLKIHIHTPYPHQIEKEIYKLGEVLQFKKERIITQSIKIKKGNIGIITEDIADLPEDIIKDFQIEIISYKIFWPEEKLIPGENIYQKLREIIKHRKGNIPQTSQPSIKSYLDAFRTQLKKFKNVIVITAASKLSGSFNAAYQAKKFLKEEEGERIFIIDSGFLSVGEALLVFTAIKLIKNKNRIDKFLEELKEKSKEIKYWAIFGNAKWYELGIRKIPLFITKIFEFLEKIKLRPIIGIRQGKVKIESLYFGNNLSEILFKEVKTKTKNLMKNNKKILAMISHCDNQEEAEKLKEKLHTIGIKVIFLKKANPIIASKAGPDTLILAWMSI